MNTMTTEEAMAQAKVERALANLKNAAIACQSAGFSISNVVEPLLLAALATQTVIKTI